MKRLRHLAVFPLEVVLFACVAVYVAAEFVCYVVGQLCQLIEGDGA